MKKRGQAAMEYVMITAFALMVAIPAFYFFREYTSSSNQKIVSNRVSQIANTILTSAHEMYYFGVPSKTVISVDMPPGIRRMGSVIHQDKTYLLVFTIETDDGPMSLYYESDIPIRVADTEPLGTGISSEDNCKEDLHPNCKIDPLHYVCECLPLHDSSEGPKNIKIEAVAKDTVHCTDKTRPCVIIDEVSAELST